MSGADELQQRRSALRKRLALIASELLELCADADVASADAIIDIGIAAGRLDGACALLRQPIRGGGTAVDSEALR